MNGGAGDDHSGLDSGSCDDKGGGVVVIQILKAVVSRWITRVVKSDEHIDYHGGKVQKYYIKKSNTDTQLIMRSLKGHRVSMQLKNDGLGKPIFKCMNYCNWIF